MIPSFAAAKPNLLNVAITRSKKRIYMIGDHGHWSPQSYFSDLSKGLPIKQPPDIRVQRPADSEPTNAMDAEPYGETASLNGVRP